MSTHTEDPSPEEIRADIERTRERIDDTVEALGAQLNPSHIKERVKARVREATIGRVEHMATNTTERLRDTGRGLAQTIRDNPVPAAMVAAGLGWLIFAGKSRRDDVSLGGYTANDGALGTGAELGVAGSLASETSGIGESVTSKVQQVTHDIADKARDATQQVAQKARDTTHQVAQKASDAAHVIGDKVTDTSQRAADLAKGAGQRVADTARTTARRVNTQYDQNPIALGAIAAAVGLAVGMALPSTEKEGQLMGAARDQFVDKTRERIADTREKVEHVVERAAPEVKSVVRDAAREEGLVK